jgi:AraC-like DNA-binding protein
MTTVCDASAVIPRQTTTSGTGIGTASGGGGGGLAGAQAALSDVVWPVRLRDVDHGGAAVRVDPVTVGLVRLVRVVVDAGRVHITLDGHGGGDLVAVAVAVAGTVECWSGREHALVWPGGGSVAVASGRISVLVAAAGTDLLVVVVPGRVLTDAAADLTGDRPATRPDFDLAQPGLAGWGRLAAAVHHDHDRGPVAGHPAVAAHAQALLGAGLLTAARHDRAGRVRDTTPGVPGRRVRAAMDWIHAHHGDPTIGPADIARATGLSQRTLYRAIRAETGMTPAECLRRVRLVAARAALRAATPTEASVTEIAGRVGFIDLSWFATQYQRVYGERPVDTLRARTTI